MERDVARTLRERGLQPSAQRVAIAEYVLRTGEHPSADQVWARVRRGFPMLSRATVYNTLNALVRKGLLRALVLAEGKVVFDPNVERHHHFVDEATGRIRDVPWEAVEVGRVRPPAGFTVHDVHVILRGRRTGRRPR
ncbi:MAG TPA: transcriptional repressor [Candidatus Binatia bacterium]|nr:transcriptional repressor [Candidatus Binatia bacterium]